MRLIMIVENIQERERADQSGFSQNLPCSNSGPACRKKKCKQRLCNKELNRGVETWYLRQSPAEKPGTFAITRAGCIAFGLGIGEAIVMVINKSNCLSFLFFTNELNIDEVVYSLWYYRSVVKPRVLEPGLQFYIYVNGTHLYAILW